MAAALALSASLAPAAGATQPEQPRMEQEEVALRVCDSPEDTEALRRIARPAFPAGTWRCDDTQLQHERSFGDVLRMLDEPLLWTDRERSAFPRRYRLLVYGIHGPAVTARLDVKADGTAVLTTASTTGPGYDPLRRRSRDVTAVSKQTADFARRLIERSYVKDMPVDLSGDPEDILCVGSDPDYLFEMVDGPYKLVRHFGCDVSPQFQRLIDVMLSLRDSR